MENQKTYKTPKNNIRERDIEKYLRDEIRKTGGKAYKFVSPGNNGVPDRIVILPGGKIVFVELKTLGNKPTALQAAQISKIRALGCEVHVIDSKLGVDGLIQEVTAK